VTAEQIAKAHARATVPYTLAAQIRTLLDDARKGYGPSKWDEDDVEQKVIELVTEDGES
jgi:hypothetical protein